jgi:hypothetical protein
MLPVLNDGFPNTEEPCDPSTDGEAVDPNPVKPSFCIAAKGEFEAGVPFGDCFSLCAPEALVVDRPSWAWPLPRPRPAPRVDWPLNPVAPFPRDRPPRPEVTASFWPPRVAPKTLPNLGMGRACSSKGPRKKYNDDAIRSSLDHSEAQWNNCCRGLSSWFFRKRNGSQRIGPCSGRCR